MSRLKSTPLSRLPEFSDGQSTAAHPTTLEVAARLGAVCADDWDACAGADDPFLCHAFLHALEESGSACPETGWLPQHLLLRRRDGKPEAALPLYLKSHSGGEYIFDHGWAHAYERAGGRYYPKLLSAVPFAPVPGSRLLLKAATDADQAVTQLCGGIRDLCGQWGLSGAHINFPDADQVASLAREGFSIRHGHQFHWRNRDFGDFDDFLATLTSRKRKTIRAERRRIREAGFHFTALQGDDIRPEDWDHFHRFYLDTYDRKWGAPHLTRAFFELLHHGLRDRVVLIMARQDGDCVAGALNLRSADALIGRNWGADLDHKFLHFETCYYQAIDYAIAHGLGRAEAGTQGEHHKIRRGYQPAPIFSAHWFAQPSFQAAVDDFLRREKAAEELLATEFAHASPYRQNTTDNAKG